MCTSCFHLISPFDKKSVSHYHSTEFFTSNRGKILIACLLEWLSPSLNTGVKISRDLWELINCIFLNKTRPILIINTLMRPCLNGRCTIVRERLTNWLLFFPVSFRIDWDGVPLGISYPLSSVNPLEGLTFYQVYNVLSRVCVNLRRES